MISLELFDSFSSKDFDNGAVYDDLRDVIKQRDALLEAAKLVKKDFLRPDRRISLYTWSRLTATIALCKEEK